MTKKYKKRAEADLGFIFIAYNLRRILNILDRNTLKEYLKIVISCFLAIITAIKTKINCFIALKYLDKLNILFIENPVNQLKLTRILTLKRSF
jgi:hypothetical protein